MSEKIRVFHGNVVYSRSEKELIEKENRFTVVKNGVVEGSYEVLPDEFSGVTVTETGEDVLIPAFSDLHVHAPQYPQRGLAMDKLLSEWLTEYTFPLEEKYADKAFARSVYEAFVDDLVRHGTMHAAIYGTIHTESTEILVDLLEERGINAFVGKVNMDTDSPQGLCERTDVSLSETEKFLEAYAGNKYAVPILTPRFAPTCGRELLNGLGRLAKKYGVGVQTHLVESRWEREEAKRRYPDCSCDTQIYERAGMLGYGPLFGGHFIFPSDEDVRILKEYDGYAVQCPDATVNVIAGIMPTAVLQENGVRLAYGSDVAAGQSLAIYTQTARSVQLSKIKAFYEKEHKNITFTQAFYNATKGSGAAFGKTGSLEEGYAFDALLIGGMSDDYEKVRPKEIVERFCYAGETANIHARFLRGQEM